MQNRKIRRGRVPKSLACFITDNYRKKGRASTKVDPRIFSRFNRSRRSLLSQKEKKKKNNL